MNERKVYTAQHIFTGDEWLDHHSIIIEDGIVTDICPASSTPVYDILLPAFIDLQLYGAYGKLYSVFPQKETLRLIHKYCCEGGAYWFQPTVATNTIEVFKNCIDGVKDYWNNGGEGCIGLHIEGPWINKAKRGAHIESLVHRPEPDEVKSLLEYGSGAISMITLAPEMCSFEIIETIQKHNIVISAGHSNISFNDANQSFDDGITAVTHLYNAMSGLHHRAPGLVGACFTHQHVLASIIADGYHVDYAAIKIACTLMKERLFLITDAVTETAEEPYQHQLSGDKFIADGILSGSALTMMQAVKNIIDHNCADKTEAIKMACTVPAKAMKMEKKIGKIAIGLPARLTATDEGLSFAEILF